MGLQIFEVFLDSDGEPDFRPVNPIFDFDAKHIEELENELNCLKLALNLPIIDESSLADDT